MKKIKMHLKLIASRTASADIIKFSASVSVSTKAVVSAKITAENVSRGTSYPCFATENETTVSAISATNYDTINVDVLTARNFLALWFQSLF